MYPQANQFPLSVSLTTKKRSAQGMVPPHWGGKAPSKASVLQAVLVKIVTEILFDNASLANHHRTIVLSADQRLAHRKDSDLHHACQWVRFVPELGEH